MLICFYSCSKESFDPQEKTTMPTEVMANHESHIIPGEYVISFNEQFLKPSSLLKQDAVQNREELKTHALASEKKAISKINEFLESLSISTDQIQHYYTAAIAGFAATLSDEELQRILAHPHVNAIEPNEWYPIPDTKLEENRSLKTNQGQTVSCAVSMAEIHNDGKATSAKWIWVIDSGIDLDHPDLNVQTNPYYALNATGCNEAPDDTFGHGTWMAGAAAAKNNNIGIKGASAGTKVVPIKVYGGSNSCFADPLDPATKYGLIDALDHIAQRDIPGDVVLYALVGAAVFDCKGIRDKAFINVGSAGTYISLSAGNDGKPVDKFAPSCINAPNVFTIAAEDCSRRFLPMCNYGASTIDYLAGGHNVKTTSPNGSYVVATGSSMATAIFSGIIHARQSPPGSCVYYPIPYKSEYYKDACK